MEAYSFYYPTNHKDKELLEMLNSGKLSNVITFRMIQTTTPKGTLIKHIWAYYCTLCEIFTKNGYYYDGSINYLCKQCRLPIICKANEYITKIAKKRMVFYYYVLKNYTINDIIKYILFLYFS